MKKTLFAFVIAVAAIASAKSHKTDPAAAAKAAAEASDKEKWGGVAYTAATGADGGTIESDLLQLKSSLARDTLAFKSLYGRVKDRLGKSSDDPDMFHAEALKLVSRPLDTLPQRDFTNVRTSPQEELGIKSLASIRHAVGLFERDVRSKVRDVLKKDVELKLMYRFNRLMQAKNLIGNEAAFVGSWRYIDTSYGKFLKIAEKIENGTDQWHVKPEELLSPQQRTEFFGKVLKASGLNEVFDEKGSMLPKIDRNARALDRILRRISATELDALNADLSTSFREKHEAFNQAAVEYAEWYKQHGLAIDPKPRQYLKTLLDSGYRTFIREEVAVISECQDLISEFKDESSTVGKLRTCKGFSPNKAFYISGEASSDGTPNYTMRVGFIGSDVKKRFDKAVREVFRRTGKPQIL